MADKKALGLLSRSAHAFGFQEAALKLHRARFPQAEQLLAWAKAHPWLENDIGGIALLPRQHPPDRIYPFPEGRIFLGDLPLLSQRHSKPGRRINYLAVDVIEGAIIWVNPERNKDIFKKFDILKDKADHEIRRKVIQRIVSQMAPEEALKAFNKVPRDFYIDYKIVQSTSMDQDTALDALCEKIAEKPGLFKLDPKWFLASIRDEDYFLVKKNGYASMYWGTAAHYIADEKLLKALGYINVHPALLAFHVPYTVDVICELENQGKIPKDRDKVGPGEWIVRNPRPIKRWD